MRAVVSAVFLTLILALSTRIIVLAGNPPKPAAHASNGYILDQVSDDQGPCQSKITPHGIRVETQESLLYILPPKFDLQLYNPKTKHYMQEPLSKFYTHIDEYPKGKDSKFSEKYIVEPIGKQKMWGLNAEGYRTRIRATKEVALEYWVTKDFGTTSQMADACTILLSIGEMRPCGAIPLRIIRIGADGSKFR